VSLKQSAFLFDYHTFRNIAMSLMAALDAGDPEPLQVRVTQMHQRAKSSKNWILHDKGTSLDDSVPAHDVRFQSGLWGHWLLIVLSEFLSPCVSLGYDWTKLSCALYSLKWDDQDIRRVYAGEPTVWLLKPGTPYQPDMVTEWSLPYWYWLRPERSTYSGWLSVEEVTRLRQRLYVDQASIEGDLRTWIQLPSNVSTANAHISRELNPDYWYEHIPVVYRQATDMLDQAIYAGKGLYLAVYQEEGDAEDWEAAVE
jgi:hypothetical protein